jgi:putative oxidoreductase
MFYQFLFPRQFRGKGVSLLLLALRAFFGVMILCHGLDKLYNFEALSFTFPDIFGFGSYTSLMLVIFTEFCCSLFLIFGLLVRLSLIPMILVMAVAFFDVHDAAFPAGEPAFIYLILLIILFISGPGKYSIDYLIDVRTQKDEEELNYTLPE